VRLSAGKGYAAPTPFVDETDVAGLWRVRALHDTAGGVDAERATTSALDIGWSTGAPGRTLEITATAFASAVHDPLVLRASDDAPGAFEIANAASPTRTTGSEFFARLARGPLNLIASYTFTRSTEADPESGARRDTPLTPRHAGEIAFIWERESRGRFGVEVGRLRTPRQANLTKPRLIGRRGRVTVRGRRQRTREFAVYSAYPQLRAPAGGPSTRRRGPARTGTGRAAGRRATARIRSTPAPRDSRPSAADAGPVAL
jgi:hypothetical protein